LNIHRVLKWREKMKKVLFLALAILLLLSLGSLSSCTGRDGDTVGSEGANGVAGKETIDMETLQHSKPCEYIKEKLAAGMEVKVALVAIEFSSTTFSTMDDDYRKWFEDLGFTYMSADHNMNTAKQIELIENYVTMGCACIITIVFGDEIADTVAKAIEAGTYVTLRKSMVSFPVSFNAASDPVGFGAGMADMIKAWADYRFPGEEKIKYATVDLSSNPVWKGTSDGIRDTLAADKRFELAFMTGYESLTIETGYEFVENALMLDPEIRIFIAFSFGQAMGMNNYIMSQPLLDPGEFAVFCADTDPEIASIVDASAEDEYVLRGFGTEGGEVSHKFLFDKTLQLLYGEIEPGLIETEPKYYYSGFGYFVDTSTESSS